jgi:hypothetical protein
MTANPSRQPQGQPTGGQFATSEHPEPSDDTLDDHPEQVDDDRRDEQKDAEDAEWEQIRKYNATGTAKYPPTPVSPKQVFEFWKGVKIPDEFLQNIQNCETLRNWQFSEELRKIQYQEPKKKVTESRATFDRRQAEWADDMAYYSPVERIPRFQLSRVVRLGHTYLQGTYLSDADCEELSNYKVDFPDGTSTTPKEVFDEYRMNTIQNSFYMRYIFHPLSQY